MRFAHLVLGSCLLAIAATANATDHSEALPTSDAGPAHPVLIEQVLTKYLGNVSLAGGYTEVKFTNTSEGSLSAIAFEVVPYAGGVPILQTVHRPVVFGAKGDFKPGKTYTITSVKPVWPGPWKRVDCVHLVGMVLEYAGGQTQKIGRTEITDYLKPQIRAQNCTNPSSPGPHN